MKNPSNSSKIAALALLLLSLSACIRGIDYSPRPINKPSVEDVAGAWLPDKATLNDMAKRGGYDTTVETKIVLRANGDLELVNMPDWWENRYGESQRKLHSYSGTWEITKGIEYWELAIFSSNMQTRFGLLGDKHPYKVEIILGDPDSGNEMIFVKQEGQ